MVGGQGGQAAVSFLANLILVRYLFPEEFGRFALIQANVLLAATTFSLRINTILLQVPDRDLESGARDQFLSALVGQTLLVGLSSVALLWLFNLWDIWALVFLLNALIDPWINAQKVLYERKFQYKNLALIEGGSHLATHVFSAVGVIGGLGPSVLYLRGWVLVFGRLGGLAIVGGLQGYKLRLLSMAEWRFIIRQIRGYWLEGWLAQSLDRLVIICLGLLVGQQMTGYYFQARRLAVTPYQLFEPVSDRILFNFLSHRASVTRGIQALKQLLAVQIPVLVLIAAVAIIGADPIIPWIFGPGWEPVIPLFQAMVGVLVGMTPFYTLGSYFRSKNYMWPFITFGQGFQYAALGIALLITLSKNFSPAYGVAIGLSVGYLGGFFLVALVLRYLLPQFDEEETGFKR